MYIRTETEFKMAAMTTNTYKGYENSKTKQLVQGPPEHVYTIQTDTDKIKCM